jgi:anti-anti-sigma factor
VNLPAAASLTIDTSSGQLESTVCVTGFLVIDTSPRLRACLRHIIERRVSPAIVIDLSGVSYFDTSAVATLVEAARVARAHDVRLRVIGLAAGPRMLAQVTEMDRIFLTLGSAVEFA